MADPLPDTWMPFEHTQLERAWAEHPEHDLLVKLADERDANGFKTWQLVRMPEPVDPTWTAHYLRPLDPTDPRPAICVTRYPRHVMDAKLSDVRAVTGEHSDD